MGIKDDYLYCKEIIKNNSKSFYKAFSLLPAHKRNAVYAIYAFCRLSDDAIDLHNDLAELEQLKKQLDDFLLTDQLNSPVFRALKDSFNKYQLELKPFYQMLEGQLMDTNFKGFETYDQLENYCYYVASTVGLMLLPILATKNHKKLVEPAIKLGYAMQLTNILRDIGEDLNLGRIYIPKSYFLKHSYSYDDLYAKNINQAFIDLWEDLAGTAEGYYQDFDQHLKEFDLDSRIPLKNAAWYYSKILEAVRQEKYDCLNKRCYFKF